MIKFKKKDAHVQKCFDDHHNSVDACFVGIENLFKEVFSENCDSNKLESIFNDINSNEAAADKKLRNIIDLMSDSFLPRTRSNLIAIVQNTDDIANLCQSIARRVYFEKIQLPEAVRQDVFEMIEITRGQLDMVYVAIDKLLNSFSAFLKDKEILDNIRREESRVDKVESMLHERIFKLDLSLTEKVYYRDIISRIGEISDRIEDLADRIHTMLVEREA